MDSLKIQMSSTKLLEFCVNDMLSLAQLDTNTFRKELSNFSIEEAIDEIMKLQQDTASYKGIDLRSSFIGFEESSIICTDKYRLQ